MSARSLADLISAFGFVLYFSVYQLYADDAPPGEKLPFNTRVLLSSWRSASPHSLRGSTDTSTAKRETDTEITTILSLQIAQGYGVGCGTRRAHRGHGPAR